jgi:hypothetical protein
LIVVVALQAPAVVELARIHLLTEKIVEAVVGNVRCPMKTMTTAPAPVKTANAHRISRLVLLKMTALRLAMEYVRVWVKLA